MERLTSYEADRLNDALYGMDTGGEAQSSVTARFVRTDQDGTTWVRFEGAGKDTPLTSAMSVMARQGDLIDVRLGGYEATGGGNRTDPSAGYQDVRAVNIEVEHVKGKQAEFEKLTAQELEAEKARIGHLEADSAEITELVAQKASIADLQAAEGRISDLESDHVSTTDLTAVNGEITNLKTTKANISDLEANYITADVIEATYMHANMSNSDVAWIQNGVIKDGAISSAMINTLSANKIVGGTADFSKMNVVNLKAGNIEVDRINGQPVTGKTVVDALTQHESDISDLDSKLDDAVDDLQGQIDGAIETWTGTEVPTLLNTPASAWTTDDDRRKHVGDVYFVVNSNSQQNGYNYRFTKTGNEYSWQLIKDSDVTNALQRLTTAEGKISTFDSDISTLKTDTGEIKTRTTNLETRMSDAEDDILDRVEKTTFNELSSTVDENSATITTHSTVLSNNGLTTTTNISNTVNSVSQTATSNSSKISQLTTTLGTNADGTSAANDVVHRVSDVEQDLDGITTRVSKTEAHIAGDFALSTTAAGTTAKTATITPAVTGWTLEKGVSITVRFDKENTVASPTLNVNSTGAKAIRDYAGNALAESAYKWKAGTVYSFICDGTYWLLQDSLLTSRVTQAESTIEQQADQISAKVSKDGVIAAINLSTETEGGSAVKISADKVNIEGAAIFTSGRLSQNSLDTQVSTAITNGTANLAGKADAIARTQRIYYRQTASGAAPGANTTWLSTSGTGYGNWSLSIPQLTSGETKYPKLYMAMQTQTVAQQAAGTACSCSTPQLDDSTTIIDGGNIITHSVTAEQLNATSINASNSLTIGAMATADQANILNSNIQVGGRNLVIDSKNFRAGDVQEPLTMASSVEDGMYKMVISDGNTANWNANWSPNKDAGWSNVENSLADGDPFVISFEMRAIGSTVIPNIYIKDSIGYKAMSGTLSESWSTVYYAGTWSESTYINPHFGWAAVNTASTYYIKSVKVEKGNKPTDWTPALEDVNDEIDDAKKTATNYIAADSTGIRIANANPSTATTYQHQTATATEFVVGGERTAQFGGSGATIGKDDELQLKLTPGAMALENDTDETVFSVAEDTATEITRNAELAVYADSSQVTTAAHTVQDSLTAAGDTAVSLNIGGTIYELDSANANVTVTPGSGVSVALTSAGVTYASGLMDEIGEGGVLSVEYQASHYDKALLSLVGAQTVTGEGVLVDLVNSSFSADNGTDTFIRALNEVTGKSIAVGVGSGGVSRGIWDGYLHRWMIHSDNARVYLNGGRVIVRDDGLQRNGGGGLSLVTTNGDASQPGVKNWRLAFTDYGNIRLDKSSNGTTWTTVDYFARESRVSYETTNVTATSSAVIIAAKDSSAVSVTVSAPSGYVFGSVYRIQSNHTQACYMTSWRYSDGTVTAWLYNSGSSSASTTITVSVRFVKVSAS